MYHSTLIGHDVARSEPYILDRVGIHDASKRFKQPIVWYDHIRYFPGDSNTPHVYVQITNGAHPERPLNGETVLYGNGAKTYGDTQW